MVINIDIFYNTKKPNDKDLGVFTMDEDKDGYLYE